MRGMVVAFALVISTLAKGLCDYLGTYLVNYAGFGLITDLRNHLYEATLRRSSSFFHSHATGTILSTLINDVDRVQNRGQLRDRRVPPAVLHVPRRPGVCHPPRRRTELGACCCLSRW